LRVLLDLVATAAAAAARAAHDGACSAAAAAAASAAPPRGIQMRIISVVLDFSSWKRQQL